MTLREIADKLKTIESAAIFCHMRPDGDTLGAALGLQGLLRACGIPSEVVCESPVPAKFFFLEGMREVASAPTKDAQAFIAVDSSDEARLGALCETFTKSKKIKFNIDHHVSNTRFGDYCYVEELAKIVTRSAGILNVSIAPEGAMEIARRSRGTPRIANRMLRRVRDFAEVRADGVITREVADEALRALEIDRLGLDPIDYRMLRAIIENYGGGPVGIDTLAATIGEESVTLWDVYEPYLMQLGFLTRTPRGRCVTRKAYEHLGLSVPASLADEAEQLSLN